MDEIEISMEITFINQTQKFRFTFHHICDEFLSFLRRPVTSVVSTMQVIESSSVTSMAGSLRLINLTMKGCVDSSSSV